MSLYSSTEAVKDSGASWGPGLYKFLVTSSEVHTSGSVLFRIKTWTEDGAEGPENIHCWLNIKSDKQGAKDEINRRLQTLLGKTSIDDAGELVGKAGYVVMQKPGKYLEPYPFGGFYDKDKKSATGKDSSAERVAQALEVKSAEVAQEEEDHGDMPF